VLSRPRMQAFVLLGATALGLYLCYRLVHPFLPALSWGLALAVVGYPIHKFICRRLPYKTLSAALTVLVIAALIIVPIVFVTQQLMRQATEAVGYAQEAISGDTWRQAAEKQPAARAVLA